TRHPPSSKAREYGYPNRYPKKESAMSKGPYEDAFEARSSSPPPEEDRRSDRLDDFRDSALEEADPLQANIDLIPADLMETAQYVANVFRKAAAEQGASLSGFGAIQPVIETQTKVSREIEKYMRFSRRGDSQETANFRRMFERS